MRVAEFFAGIGLVRQALQQSGFSVVWANDIDPNKQAMYVSNFGPDHFLLADIRDVTGTDIPDVELATASFPCTDLSLAGNRAGLSGVQSGMFWEFARILKEMGNRRPQTVLLENVPSFATSNGGRDLYNAIRTLNTLGYVCDLMVINARHFVPQSRPRLFIVGARSRLRYSAAWDRDPLRPDWIKRFAGRHQDLDLQAMPLVLPSDTTDTLADIVERLPEDDPRWWNEERSERFRSELSAVQSQRLERMKANTVLTWATAYRRTRNGRPAWEIRADAISGCLRTARGGSSKQALVEAGAGASRIRWMTAREYARLQGAGDYKLDGIPENRALFGFGDAVCVPVVVWLAEVYLAPLIRGDLLEPAVPQQMALALA